MLSVKSFHESFYGTPTVDETRRRRGKKRHPVAKEEPQNEVAVTGVHYRSFDDDSMAAFVNSATALVPWNGDSKLLIDRYDVRHLLQDLTGIRRRRARPPSPDATKEELDYERYRDVEGLENPSPPEDNELKNENATGDGYQRVGFDYSIGADQATHKERAEDALFSPPFFVPEHLRSKIPTSTKVHQIMAGTAKYVIEHGGQAEIVLRVKQANNPTFGFLMPDHYDHEYFRFLVAHPEHVGIGTPSHPVAAAEVAVAASSEEAEGGLSLLGTAYGDADEDEENTEEGAAHVDQAEEQLVVSVEEVQERVDDAIKQPSEGNSDHGTTSKRSSTINQTTSDGAENATKDTGDSLDVSLGSVLPMGTDHEEASEFPVDGNDNSSSGLQEPAPPGMEASCSEEKEEHEAHSLSGDLSHQVPPYKEPPIRLRLIIDKMVDFISRNGTEFEAIVKERDKSDHRFPFFLPWNEYYPYYTQELEAARQVQALGETDIVGVPSTSESLNALEGQVLEKDKGHDSFLNGVPFWDESQTVESHGGNEEDGLSVKEYKTDKSHNGEGGMGFDAVLAAIRVATRGHPRAVDGGEEADLPKVSNERPEMGSDEAVLAAIRTATRGTKLDSSGSSVKEEIVEAAGSSGAAVGDARDPIKTSTALPLLSTEAPVTFAGDHVVVANVVGTAAAVTAEDGDSLEPRLAIPERRKAERLKKAKLFAAMIKDKNGSAPNPGQLFGSLGISAPTMDRLNHVVVTSESVSVQPGNGTVGASMVVEPEIREQTGEGQLQVAPEAEKVLVASGLKERKHKGKSKEYEEKHRKHHHKRKKDTEDRGKESKHSPGEGEKGTDKNHDHYQGGKQKDRKHGPEVKGKDSRWRVSEGKVRDDEGGWDFEDSRKEQHEESWKDRSRYIHNAEGKRKDSKHGHEAEEKKIGARHGQDFEWTQKESRHRHDSEEKRREDRHKHDADQRKSSRHRHDSEEKRSGGGRYAYDSEEMRKERSHSHGKRKKNMDKADESYDNDSRRNERRSKKSRQHSDEFFGAAEHIHVERQSLHRQDVKDDRKLGLVELTMQDPSSGTSLKRASVSEKKPALTSVDVPDDIRAKVRAMLAMM